MVSRPQGFTPATRRLIAVRASDYNDRPTDGVLGVATTKSSVGGISDAIPGKHHGGCRNVAVSARRLAAALAAIDNSEVTVALREAGLHIHLHPGPIEGFPAQPDTDSVALVGGIKST